VEHAEDNPVGTEDGACPQLLLLLLLLAEVPLCDSSSLAAACCAFQVGKLASAWSIRERTMTTAFMLTTWTHAVKILVQ
jgi:hypothetical protein